MIAAAAAVQVAAAATAAERLTVKIRPRKEGTATKKKQALQGGQPTRGQGNERLLRCDPSTHPECEYVLHSDSELVRDQQQFAVYAVGKQPC